MCVCAPCVLIRRADIQRNDSVAHLPAVSAGGIGAFIRRFDKALVQDRCAAGGAFLNFIATDTRLRMLPVTIDFLSSARSYSCM